MLIYKTGDLLKASEWVICHQVNCLGKMGAGLAKQIKEKYPLVYSMYRNKCHLANVKNEPEKLLGDIQIVEVLKSRIIINLFAQVNYGREQKLYTNYEALRLCLSKVFNFINIILQNSGKKFKCEVAIPFGIGCGLAGGSWDTVVHILSDVFLGCDVSIYKLENNYVK